MHRSRPSLPCAFRDTPLIRDPPGRPGSALRLIALAAILGALTACQTASGDSSGSRFTGAYGGMSGGYGQGRVPGS